MCDERITKLQEEMVIAQEGRDCQKYVRLCEELGISPTDNILYQQGLDQRELRILEQRELEKLLGRINIEKYNNFLEAAVNSIGLSPEYGKCIDSKERLLEKYFPEKFGRDSPQDFEVKNYSPAQIDKLYFAFIKNAKSKVKERRLSS